MNENALLSRLTRAGLHVDAHAQQVLSASPSHEEWSGLVDALSSWENSERLPHEQSATWICLSLEWDAFLASTESSRIPPKWVDALPDFEGEVIVSGESLEKAAWDFGKVRRRKPAAVVRPANSRDVVRAVSFCRQHRIPLSPRGFAHSAGAQMQVRNGLVLDMKSMNRIHDFTDEYCEVDGGAGWDVVLKAATERNRTPPIVTDWLMVSVGGTVSMGGFGFMSFWRGTQMDHLLELEVVTGEGKVVRCSQRHNRPLFDAVRGTHGKFGIITRARIPLEEAPESVRLVQACYGNLRAMWQDLQTHARTQQTDLIHAFAAEKSVASIKTKMNSTEEMDFPSDAVEKTIQSAQSKWIYNLELVDFIGGPHAGRHPPVNESRLHCEAGLSDAWEMSWQDFCFRVPPLVLEEQFRGAAPHPELCAWIPMTDAGLDVMDNLFQRMDPVEDVGRGPVLFFPIHTKLISPPFFRVPDFERCLFFGLLRRAEPPSNTRIADLMADNEIIFETIRDIGGTRYLPDTPPETASFWKQHFGARWQAVQDCKKRWDPDGIFTSSFGSSLGTSS